MQLSQPLKTTVSLSTVMVILCIYIFLGTSQNNVKPQNLTENETQSIESTFPVGYPFPLDFFNPQSKSRDDLHLELKPNDQYDDAILRINRGNSWVQEIIVSSITGLKNSPRPFTTAEILDLIDLDQNGELEIVFLTEHQGAAGGARLTYIIYYNDALGAYFTTPGFDRIKIIDYQSGFFSKPTFLTHDFSFFSTMIPTIARDYTPIKLLQFEDTHLLDVTDNYLQIVADDAEYWLAYAENRRPVLSQTYIELMGLNLDNWHSRPEVETQRILLAPYLANMYRLNRESEGWEKLKEMCNESDDCNLFFYFLASSLISSSYTDTWPAGISKTIKPLKQ